MSEFLQNLSMIPEIPRLECAAPHAIDRAGSIRLGKALSIRTGSLIRLLPSVPNRPQPARACDLTRLEP